MKFYRLNLALMVMMAASLLWGAAGAVHAQAAAEAGFFEEFEAPPGARFEVPVEVRGVADLYAIDIEIRFDPAILQVEDANPDAEGVQPALGTFLEPGLTLFNTVDNAEGVVRFAMSQVNPAEPKSGDGVVLVLYFVAGAEGESSLTVSFLEASDRFGDAVALEPADGVVRIVADAPEVVATSIPVQDQGGLIAVPTLAPTPTPTEAPPTAETLPVAEAVGEAEAAGEVESEPGQAAAEPEMVEEDPAAPVESAGATILDYWWAVLIAVLLAVGLGIYLAVSKKQPGA